jgi:hypothetical protein
MLVGIHQSHYLPWLRYLDKVARSDVFIVMDDVDFTKRGWQKRNRIKSAHGEQLLTLPVKHHTGALPLNHVELAGPEEALAKHARAIELSYQNAPHFDQYWPALSSLFHRPWTRLVDLNNEMLTLLNAALGIATPVRYSSEIPTDLMATERLAALVKGVGGTGYLSGAHAVDAYLDPMVFERESIELVIQEWVAPEYRQQFPKAGFIRDLSVIDLLFNEGDRSLEILLSGGSLTRPA